jgi:acetylornithine deacetylase/succinyl-diaminopimelate desuccinylase-like protein
MIDPVLDYLETNRDAAIDRLKSLLAIPSISTDSAHNDDVRRAAQWVATTLGEVGMEVEVQHTNRHPIVIAHSPPVDGPHLLFYGHYDVQPPDPLEQWDTPPFEPTIKNDAIYARGASDDKGQVCCFLEALRAWHAVHGKLPMNVSVVIEGEEESGSEHLAGVLAERRDELKRDGSVVIISDTVMWKHDTVAITYGLRGMLYMELKLHGPKRDLHSGIYGGILANPATILTRVLGKLFDDNNRITIPGFYDDVQPLTDDERNRWVKLGFNESEYLAGVGVSEPFGEAGYDTLERKWVRPSCDINGIYGGYAGEGAKTVIPATVGAKVSFRLAPTQNPGKIAKAFRQWIESHNVGGCRWEIAELGRAEPVVVPTDSLHLVDAERAIEMATGKRPVRVREGATIPVVADFSRILDLDSLLIGFGRMDDCIHSPNEKFELSSLALGSRTHAVLLQELAKPSATA